MRNIFFSLLVLGIITSLTTSYADTGDQTHTGTISLDRDVYPIPFGDHYEFDESNEAQPAIFPIHETSIHYYVGESITDVNLIIYVRVTDPDPDYVFDPNDEDGLIAVDGDSGPISLTVSRGDQVYMLGTAGSASFYNDGFMIDDGERVGVDRDFGPLEGISEDPRLGIFEIAIPIGYEDGPVSDDCPVSNDNIRNCILQGDILTVTYNDPFDASGNPNTVTDSATFDLRNGVLQTDKSVYTVGSDMILTLIEPDLDLDSKDVDYYTLGLIEWNSDEATLTLDSIVRDGYMHVFDPLPPYLQETGESTGIFQTTIKIPETLDGWPLDRGEEIELEYIDWGPSKAQYVGEQSENIHHTIFTSNFGATVDLDQKAYTWTDRVHITIEAPDHNFNRDLVDDIGDTDYPITITTRDGAKIDNYELLETGADTGIFTGEVILTGFAHDVDGDGVDDIVSPRHEDKGPTGGKIPAGKDDGITVSFEFSEDDIVLGSALIKWNTGEVEWLDTSYPATGTGIVRVIDPDMNLNPEEIDTFVVYLWSNYDRAGISLTVTETNEETGIFEGTVTFTSTGESSSASSVLRVLPGDEVSAKYADHTLPDPYSTRDSLDIISTVSIQGTYDLPTSIITLDKSTYTWTDKVDITITSDAHNLDSNEIDIIGITHEDKVTVSTRGNALEFYELAETGPNTGVFTGHVTLTGFTHDTDGNSQNGNEVIYQAASGAGPIGGTIPAKNIDAVSVSFRVSDDEVLVESSDVMWNMGDVEWLSTQANQSSVRVIDSDMNLDPKAVDNFEVFIYSDSSYAGISLTVTETGISTGIFEGTVTFTSTGESFDSTLYALDGDEIVVEYDDRTLPPPSFIIDEFTTDARMTLSQDPLLDTTLLVEPFESSYMSNEPINFTGTALPSPLDNTWDIDVTNMGALVGSENGPISVEQPVNIISNMTTSNEQSFVYLLQVTDENNAPVSVSSNPKTIDRSLDIESVWTPTESGTYTATAFFWESLSNPVVLHPSTSMTLNVGSNDNPSVTIPDTDQIPITFLITDSDDDVVVVGEVFPASDGSFSDQIPLLDTVGQYTINVQYQNTKFVANITISESQTAQANPLGTDPTPADPTPTDPVEPEIVEPGTDPTPADPTPTDPVEPEIVEPGTDPTPADPAEPEIKIVEPEIRLKPETVKTEINPTQTDPVKLETEKRTEPIKPTQTDPQPEPVKSDGIKCGVGTEPVNGICRVISDTPSDPIKCGAGTEPVNGICRVVSANPKSDNANFDFVEWLLSLFN